MQKLFYMNVKAALFHTTKKQQKKNVLHDALASPTNILPSFD